MIYLFCHLKTKKHRIFWNTKFYHLAKFELKRVKKCKSSFYLVIFCFPIRPPCNAIFNSVCRIIWHNGAAGDSYGAPLKCRTLCMHHAYIKFIIFYPDNPARFYVLAMRRTLNWERAGKEEQYCSFCFKNTNYTYFSVPGVFLYSLFSLWKWWKFKLSGDGKQAAQSHIVSHASQK